MLLIPYSTDAPIYHFPWCTIGLIVVNVVVFVGMITLPDTEESSELLNSFVLQFDTINPIQWLSNNFMHADLLHLLGNLFFLWGFGLVVEGKLGWKRFLPLYLGMGVIYGAVIQLVMFLLFRSEGGALGASGVIFALMGIAVLWAPKNDLNCILWLGFYSRVLEVSIVVFGAIYIGLQLAFLALGGFQMSSAMLHVTGLAIGIPVGYVFLKKELVDCEGWDYFTVYFADSEQRKLRQTRRSRERSAARTDVVRNEAKDRLAQLDKSLSEALNAGNPNVACAMYDKFSADFQYGKRWPDDVALKLISALQRERKWRVSIPLIVNLLEKHPAEKTTAVRLNLAKLLIAKTDQPRQGLAVLAKIPAANQNEKQQEVIAKLTKMAERKKKDGNVEMNIHDW